MVLKHFISINTIALYHPKKYAQSQVINATTLYCTYVLYIWVSISIVITYYRVKCVLRWKPYNVICTNSHARECCIMVIYGQGPIKLDAYVISCPFFYITSHIVSTYTIFPFDASLIIYKCSFLHIPSFEWTFTYTCAMVICKEKRVKIHVDLVYTKTKWKIRPF